MTTFKVLQKSAIILISLLSLLFAATPAIAARGHVLSKLTIGTPGSGPGQLNEPAGVAVNEATGDIYVVDKGNNRVEVFNEKGEYQFAFNGSGSEPLIEGPGSPLGVYPGEFAAPETIAVDNSTEATDPSKGDVYVTTGDVVDKFSSSGEYLVQLTGFENKGEPQPPLGVGVDPSGNVWAPIEHGTVFELNNAVLNEPAGSVGAHLGGQCGFLISGFAVDSEENLYTNCGIIAKFSSKPPFTVDETHPLNEAFYTEPSTGIATELSSNDVYVDTGVAVKRVAPEGLVEGLPLESLPLTGQNGTGVGVNSKEEELYVAQSSGTVEVWEREPVGPPTVESEAVSHVTAESATLQAEVNPRSEPNEASTKYYFEYTTEERFQREGFQGASSAPQPAGVLAPTYDVDTLAPVNVPGLAAGTVYHFRLRAENDANHTVNVVYGPQRTFTTQTAGEFQLPDDRQWEMVSPPNKHGARILPLDQETPIQAAAGGGAIVFAANAPTEPEPAGYTGTAFVLANRTSSGWSSRDLTLPHVTVTPESAGKGTETRAFSSDLSAAIVQPHYEFLACRSAAGTAQPCLSPDASEQTAFLADLEGTSEGTEPTYTPLVTGCPAPDVGTSCPKQVEEHANVPAGTVFGLGDDQGVVGPCPPIALCGPQFVDATPDLEHVVLESVTALTSPSGGSLYEWSANEPPAEQLAPVSILPPTAEEVAKHESGQPVEGTLGFDSRNVRNAISADGSRVFWSTGISGRGPLYVRDVVKGETLQIAGDAGFQDASSDGSRVFYTEGGTLYECHLIENAGGKLECEGESEGKRTELASGIFGLIPGVSEDGSYLYFVASNASVEGKAVPGAVAGQPNLYVRHDGTTRLIAVLSEDDTPDWGQPIPFSGGSELSSLTARVSPDGRYLAFMSQRELTGYDNRDVNSGKPDEEVYLYHAPESLATGSGALTCASCNPTGARPVGEEGKDTNTDVGGVVGGVDVWGEVASARQTWLAANVPGWNPYTEAGERAIYQPRYLSDSGRLFFNARDPLVPAAVNENWDVYEFEPAGIVSPEGKVQCSAATSSGSEVYRPEHAFTAAPVAKGEQGLTGVESAGCVALISSGESDQESAFLDADEGAGEGEGGKPGTVGGNDVFFMTTAKLLEQDVDNSYDIYDAHECTTQSPCPPPAAGAPSPCETEASCKPTPEPQPGIYGPPPTATFSGPGNPGPATPAVVKKPTTKPARCKSGFVRKTVKPKKGKAKSQCIRVKRKQHKRKR